MIRELVRGAAAGTLGTAVLNMTTYGDMAVRGRPASDTPTETASKLAKRTHLGLQKEGEEPEKKEHRAEGLGALLGFASGVAVGALYGVVRERLPEKAVPFAGFGVGVAAMLAGNGPQIALGVTDPRNWNAKSWVMDIVPHMAYGFATVGAYESMRSERTSPVEEPQIDKRSRLARIRT